MDVFSLIDRAHHGIQLRLGLLSIVVLSFEHLLDLISLVLGVELRQFRYLASVIVELLKQVEVRLAIGFASVEVLLVVVEYLQSQHLGIFFFEVLES